jgi:hypothetical protein
MGLKLIFLIVTRAVSLLGMSRVSARDRGRRPPGGGDVRRRGALVLAEVIAWPAGA